MSCRTTKGGVLSHRLARHHSGLPDKTVQALFHALKREGSGLPRPSDIAMAQWRIRTRTAIEEAGLTPSALERSERDLFLAAGEDPDGATFYSWTAIEARARQEAVIRGVKGLVVDLDPPGSQSGSYQLGLDGRPIEVWYASYGSNLNHDRFITYIAGGTPTGSETHHEGARDKTLPEEDVPIRFSGRMHFAANSGRWNGGIAFMDVDPASPGHALGRAYRISMEQFDDVVAQENGRTPGQLTVPTTETLEKGRGKATFGLYGTLEHIGDYKGAPVLTFTSSFTANEALRSSDSRSRGRSGWASATNTPSDNYLRMIGGGLGETFGMSTEEQADYLRGCLGAHTLDRAHTIEVLSTPATPPPPRRTSATPSGYRPIASRTSPLSHSGSPARPARSVWDTFDDDDSYTRDRNYRPWHEKAPASRWDETEPELWDTADFADTPAALDSTIWHPTSAQPYVDRRYCHFCGGYGHKINDCPALPA
jgi:hypothetical protein